MIDHGWGRQVAIALGLAVVAGAALGCASPDTGDSEAAENSALIEYIAHACFRITSPGGERVVIDPFASQVWIGYDFPVGISADAFLISHPHYDHDAGLARGHAAPWPAGTRVLRDPGVHQVGELRITGVAGKHADPWGKEFGQTNTIWLIEVAGLRIVLLGDNGPVTAEVADQLGRVDILMMPIDSDYHILKRAEIDAIRDQLAPAVVIPMHYRHPDLEASAESPDGLGEIDGWLESQESVRRLDGHTAEFAVRWLPSKPEVVVFRHSPEVRPG